jgi:hypothetical protein
VENHRKSKGLASISSKCFGVANISTVLLDDGIVFDKMLDWKSHKSFVPTVGRILRIEHLAETILNDVSIPLLLVYNCSCGAHSMYISLSDSRVIDFQKKRSMF